MRIKNWLAISLVGIVICLIASTSDAQDAKQKLKIFILAGQSNMEGKGSVQVMRHQLTVPEKKDRFARYDLYGK